MGNYFFFSEKSANTAGCLDNNHYWSVRVAAKNVVIPRAPMDRWVLRFFLSFESDVPYTWVLPNVWWGVASKMRRNGILENSSVRISYGCNLFGTFWFRRVIYKTRVNRR